MAPTLRSSPELDCRGVSRSGTPKQAGFLRNCVHKTCVCMSVDDVERGEKAGNASELGMGRGHAVPVAFPAVGGGYGNQILRHDRTPRKRELACLTADDACCA